MARQRYAQDRAADCVGVRDSSVLSAPSHLAMRPTHSPLEGHHPRARSFERPTDHGASAPPIVSISFKCSAPTSAVPGARRRVCRLPPQSPLQCNSQVSMP